MTARSNQDRELGARRSGHRGRRRARDRGTTWLLKYPGKADILCPTNPSHSYLGCGNCAPRRSLWL